MEKCSVCGRDFKTKGGLGSHFRIHAKDEPDAVVQYNKDGWGYFRCDYVDCDFKTKSRESFRKHINRHKTASDKRKEAKDFIVGFCPKCGKGFRGAGARANHMGYCMKKPAPESTDNTTGRIVSLLDQIGAETSEEKRMKAVRELKTTLGISSNTGCIDRMFCPKCKDSNSFKIAGQVVLTVDAVGAHMDKDKSKVMRWDDFSIIECNKCGWKGQVGEWSPKDAPREAPIVISES